MTFLDVTAHYVRTRDEKEALLEERVRLLCGYRDEFEDKGDIAVEMLATACACSKDDAARMVDDAYEVRQRARKVAVT